MRRALPLLLLALAPAAARAQDYARDEYTAPREADVDARGARRVSVEGHAGYLRVRGVEGLTQVRVRGTARASRREVLDRIRIETRRDGDVVLVRADVPDQRDGDRWGDDNRALDLVVEVPLGIAADVRDGSGALEVRGVGALDVEDGSGEIDVRDVASARIRDGSGEIRVEDVRGDVRLSDGSGSIAVRRVRGSVLVENDGSGGIEVREVEGDLTVDRARGRAISYSDVRGRVDVPRDTRGRRSWY
ncbi:hypothetical protein [Roseisolibacter sp. H3M3-2]|uniref:hypothetical protein n=1 Tax=Roseisolibacter sp. H3M3-2 TaxID=3031323 RepID=UPI0023DC9ECD|nr:hypothetical protein [Roseisolibacter sp. H3M3-2]MDF1504135.1 hypothetical protein [Roseisolibacter sp. H3M3-2]